MNKNRITAIVLAAGKGKRMNTAVAKQFLMLQDKPLLYYALKVFEESSVDEVILVTGSDQIEYCKEQIVSLYQIKKVTKIIEGGRERYDSVYQALKSAGQTDYVLIHDGARPFITVELVNNIIQQVKEYKACIVGTPVKETIKVVNDAGYIASTPNREILWTAQTPQAFAYVEIQKAYELLYKEEDIKRQSVTDDAMVYETYLKKPVKILHGSYHNVKITTREDLVFAEAFLEDMAE